MKNVCESGTQITIYVLAFIFGLLASVAQVLLEDIIRDLRSCFGLWLVGAFLEDNFVSIPNGSVLSPFLQYKHYVKCTILYSI
jgi:hypothetical protein